MAMSPRKIFQIHSDYDKGKVKGIKRLLQALQLYKGDNEVESRDYEYQYRR